MQKTKGFFGRGGDPGWGAISLRNQSDSRTNPVTTPIEEIGDYCGLSNPDLVPANENPGALAGATGAKETIDGLGFKSASEYSAGLAA